MKSTPYISLLLVLFVVSVHASSFSEHVDSANHETKGPRGARRRGGRGESNNGDGGARQQLPKLQPQYRIRALQSSSKISIGKGQGLGGAGGTVGKGEMRPMKTSIPIDILSEIPSEVPSEIPSNIQNEVPIGIPTELPSEEPSLEPSYSPPSFVPSSTPTNVPMPSEEPSSMIPTQVVRIFLLLGDSTMVGRGSVEHLEELVYDQDLYNFLRVMEDDDPALFRSKDNVRITFNYEEEGTSSPLVVGYGLEGDGPNDSDVFGVDVGFGWALLSSSKDDGPCLLVKVAERGARVGVEWLSPSSPLLDDPPSDDYGLLWREMMTRLDDIFERPMSYIPFEDDINYSLEVSGIVTFMGWNDAYDDSISNFESIFSNFLIDLVMTFGDGIPILVGEMGQDLSEFSLAERVIVEVVRQGQISAVDRISDFVLGAENVEFVPTRPYVIAPSEQEEEVEFFNNVAHYYGRADTYMDIGLALGEAMNRLQP